MVALYCVFGSPLQQLQHYREAGMFEVTDDKTGETLHCAATRFYGMKRDPSLATNRQAFVLQVGDRQDADTTRGLQPRAGFVVQEAQQFEEEQTISKMNMKVLF